MVKLDINNKLQMDLMWSWFRHNMAVVYLWLNLRVLLQETHQFPQRLATSAWDLAQNPRQEVVGFSGTNDNHRLLPLSVHQDTPDEKLLLATNGKMMDIILKNRSCTTLVSDAYQEQISTSGGIRHLFDTL